MESLPVLPALALSALLLATGPAHAESRSSPVATGKAGIAAARFGAPQIASANAAWYYNWRNTPNAGTLPAGAAAPEYVPMLSRPANVTDAAVADLAAGKANGTYKYLLGFNEPDHAEQANMSVAQAISLWPKLMETGLILGSPSPTNPNAWLDDFMAQAAAKGYRVDFVCLHYYRPPNAANAVADLKKWLTDAYARYRKPIWLTEFGAPDCRTLGWCGGNAPALTQAQMDAFVAQVVPMLNGLEFVHRYAWFVDRSQPGFELSTVFKSDGSLTPTGITLRSAMATTGLRTQPMLRGSNRFQALLPPVRVDGRRVEAAAASLLLVPLRP